MKRRIGLPGYDDLRQVIEVGTLCCRVNENGSLSRLLRKMFTHKGLETIKNGLSRVQENGPFTVAWHMHGITIVQ